MTSPEPIVLAVDTATDVPGVALRKGGITRVRAIGWRAAFRETAPAVVALLAETGITLADVDALAIPAGPGSFTGLRVGASLAVAMARASGIPLHAVPTLEAVAEAYAPPGLRRVCSVIDARRGRWYAAIYERDGVAWRAVEGPVDVAPEAMAAFAGGAPVVGPVPGADAGGQEPGADAGGQEPVTPGTAPVAVALAGIVAAAPELHRLASPADLRLLYARSGTLP